MNNIAGALYRVIKIKNEMKCSRRMRSVSRQCQFKRMPNSYTWDFPDVIKVRIAVHMISEKAIRIQHPNYNPDWAQKLISSSMSRHLSTRNISSKYLHAFLSNLANRQTDKRMRANAFTSSFVADND